MRRAASAVLVAALALAWAGPAWGHEEITPSTIPVGKPVFFVLSAANEGKADLTKITLTAPTGVAFGGTTREPPGWSVNRSDAAITWSGGAVKPDHFEQWGFEIDAAPQPATLSYKVTLGFADGKSDDVEVPVVATAGAAPSPGGAPTPPAVTASTPTSAPGAPAPRPPAVSDTTARRRANLALGVGVLAAVGALAAAVLAATGRRRGPGSASSAGSGPGGAQDW